jgi:hypothetical protein
VEYARSEGRFAKQFGKDGAPSENLLAAQADRLANWHLLQELAGVGAPGGAGAKSAPKVAPAKAAPKEAGAE